MVELSDIRFEETDHGSGFPNTGPSTDVEVTTRVRVRVPTPDVYQGREHLHVPLYPDTPGWSDVYDPLSEVDNGALKGNLA